MSITQQECMSPVRALADPSKHTVSKVNPPIPMLYRISWLHAIHNAVATASESLSFA